MLNTHNTKPGITVTNEVAIDHAILGYEAWEWDAEQQAAFLAAFATELRNAPGGAGIMQIHHLDAELRKDPNDLEAVRWLNEHLTEYLADES